MNRRPASIPNLPKEIRSGKVYPVYLLCGEEDYLIERTLAQMLDLLLEESTRDFNLSFLDGVEASVREILSAVEVYPMMSDWRVVVVREPTVFKTQKGKSPVELVQNAIDVVEEKPLRALSIIVKVLGITALDIADENADFRVALQEFNQEHRENLAPAMLEFLQNLPQLTTQLGEVESLSGTNDETEVFIEWLKDTLPEKSVLIFTVKGAVDKRGRLAKAIDQVGRFVSFDPLEMGGPLQKDPLFQSISRKLEESGKRISTSAFQVLRSRTGNDMHLIFEGLEKIVSFVGEKKQIDERDIEALITQSSFDSIFALTDAIGKRSLPQALASLHSVLDSGEPPIKVNALVARQIRLALQAKLLVEKGVLQPNVGQSSYRNFAERVLKPLATQNAKALPESQQLNLLKQNPYAAFKVIQSLPYFSTDELIQGLEKTLDADIQLKSSQLDAVSILEQLVYELCARPRTRRTSSVARVS